MNADQQARLEIMRALGEEFPDRLLEDLVHVARYVEHGGTEPEATEPVPSAQQLAEDGERIRNGLPPLHIKDHEPRKWVSLEDIPAHVLAVTDPDGDVIRRIALGNRLVWKFEAKRYDFIVVTDALAPFTEVLS